MNLSKVKIYWMAAAAFVTLLYVGCIEQAKKTTDHPEVQNIFPKGEPVPAENFTGKAWNIGLVANDTIYNTVLTNVSQAAELQP